MSPQRIKREADWKQSKDQVWVGPRSKFYNPFAAKIQGGESGLATMSREYLVEEFRHWLTVPTEMGKTAEGWAWVTFGGWDSYLGIKYVDRIPLLENLEKLRGKDLVCRCHISQPCHADVLLNLANREVPA